MRPFADVEACRHAANETVPWEIPRADDRGCLAGQETFLNVAMFHLLVMFASALPTLHLAGIFTLLQIAVVITTWQAWRRAPEFEASQTFPLAVSLAQLVLTPCFVLAHIGGRSASAAASKRT